MIRDAEANADADKQAKELIDAKNNAEAMVYNVEKDAEELKDSLSESEKAEIDTAVNSVKEAIKSEDKEKIVSSQNELMNAFKILSDKKQAQSQPESGKDDNVVDAEFKEA
jgi:molecular chaperone DnaK